MNVDENAAAYGSFVVHFTWLTDRLAAAVFYLQVRTNPSLCFRKVIIDGFGPNHQKFKNELQKFPDSLHKQMGLQVCTEMRELADWRNERIHARIDFDPAAKTLALYSWRTRLRLPMNSE